MSRDKLRRKSERIIDLKELVSYAEEVAIERGALVAEVLFHLAAIRNLQDTPATGANATIACVGNPPQEASAQHGQQAAHLLPGKIKVKSENVWLLARWEHGAPHLKNDLLRLSQQTKLCFAKVNILPVEFNRADSAAEVMAKTLADQGLKQLFGHVVRQMWHGARVDAKRHLLVDRRAVLEALGSWFTQVNGIYEAAAQQKREKAEMLSKEKDGKEQRRKDEATILETYARSFLVQNPARFVNSYVYNAISRYTWLY